MVKQTSWHSAHRQPVHSTPTSEDTKTIVTVLLLIFAFPIGLILMWAWTNWPKWVKVIITLPIFLFIMAMVAMVFLIAINPAKQLRRAECVQKCVDGPYRNVCVQQCSLIK